MDTSLIITAGEMTKQSMSKADFHKTHAMQRTQRKQWERQFQRQIPDKDLICLEQ